MEEVHKPSCFYYPSYKIRALHQFSICIKSLFVLEEECFKTAGEQPYKGSALAILWFVGNHEQQGG